MTDTDKLAQVLAEHGDWGYGRAAFIRCDCGAHVGFPDDDGQHKGKRAHAAHLAAEVLAHLSERAEADKAKNVEEAWCASRWLARIMQEADHA